MIKGDYYKLTELAGNHLCPEHGTPVLVAWHSGEKCWTLRCASNHYPDMLTRVRSLTEINRSGELPDGPIKDNIDRKERQRKMTQQKQFSDSHMALVPHVDLGTGELLKPEMMQLIVKFAYRYRLDPYRGHVVIMYGKPYIGLDGYLFHAAREGKSYNLKSRPLTAEECKTYHVGEEDHGWIAELTVQEPPGFFTGIGVVTQEEMTAKSKHKPDQLAAPVVAAHPWQLCQKRAEWQALRRAFPIGEELPAKETANASQDKAEAVEP